MSLFKATCIAEEMYHRVTDNTFRLTNELAVDATNISKLVTLSKIIVKDTYRVIDSMKHIKTKDFMLATYCAMFKDVFHRLQNVYVFTLPKYRNTEMEYLLDNGHDKIFSILEAFTALRFRFM